MTTTSRLQRADPSQLGRLHALAEAVAKALPFARRGALYTSHQGLELFRRIRELAPYDDLHAIVQDIEHDLEPQMEESGFTLINRMIADERMGQKL